MELDCKNKICISNCFDITSIFFFHFPGAIYIVLKLENLPRFGSRSLRPRLRRRGRSSRGW